MPESGTTVISFYFVHSASQNRLGESAMNDKQAVIEEIRAAFGQNPYPGDDFLQGSFEGSEPSEEIEPFRGQDDWESISSQLLDAHYVALSFFSEAGLRFFLPAYLIADLQEELKTADPLFTLVHGFSDLSVPHRTKTTDFRSQDRQTRPGEPQAIRGLDLLRLCPLAPVSIFQGRSESHRELFEIPANAQPGWIGQRTD